METYNSPESTGGLGGVKRFAEATGKSYQEARKLLRSNPAYTLHRPAIRKFRRRKYIVAGIDSLWQADLGDFVSLSRSNRGVKYVLFVIDVFSKVLWLEPVTNKRASAVCEAFKKILGRAQPRLPQNVMTDKGTEFSVLKKYLTQHGIKYYNAENSETKASVAERVIRTIKGRMYRYFTHTATTKFIDKLQDFADAYNSSVHRTIGMKPVDVTPENSDKVFARLYKKNTAKRERQPKFKVGDHIRISIARPTFAKGYKANWTTEIFKVSKRHTTVPPVYEIVDVNNETIKGTFYEQEMQKVS